MQPKQKNLEQIRALHALDFWSTERVDCGLVKKLPPMVLDCGLLATLAFAQSKQRGYATLMAEVGKYLGSTGLDGRGLLPREPRDLGDFIEILSKGSSTLLRLATAEAVLYLGYLKRLEPASPSTPSHDAVPASR